MIPRELLASLVAVAIGAVAGFVVVDRQPDLARVSALADVPNPRHADTQPVDTQPVMDSHREVHVAATEVDPGRAIADTVAVAQAQTRAAVTRVDAAVDRFERNATLVEPLLRSAAADRHRAVDRALTSLAEDHTPTREACRETADALTRTPLRAPAISGEARRQRRAADEAARDEAIAAFFAVDADPFTRRIVHEVRRVDTDLEDQLVRVGFERPDLAEATDFDAPDVDDEVDLAVGRLRTLERIEAGLIGGSLVAGLAPGTRRAIVGSLRGARHVSRVGRVGSPLSFALVTGVQVAGGVAVRRFTRRDLANALCTIAAEEVREVVRDDGSRSLRGQLEAAVGAHDDDVRDEVMWALAHESVSR